MLGGALAALMKLCPCAESLHPWVVWLYYLNPLTYAFRALVVSEFSAPRWDHPAPSNPSMRAGTAVLQANALDLPTLWTWASVLLLVGYIIVINIVVVLGLKLLNGELARKLESQSSDSQSFGAITPVDQ